MRLANGWIVKHQGHFRLGHCSEKAIPRLKTGDPGDEAEESIIRASLIGGIELKFALSVTFTLGVFTLLNWPWGILPPLGKVLNPFSGLWRNTPQKIHQGPLALKGLKAPVEVHWDEHSIPHVFAKNNHDLYMVQGYLLAQERLFQMDITTRMGLGRLAELLGPKALKMDRLFVSAGLRESGRRAYQTIQKDPLLAQAIEAYTKGVKAYLKQLKPMDYPPEYKLLNVAPGIWDAQRTTGLLMTMAYMLSGRTQDVELTRIAKKYGFSRMREVFPLWAEDSYPVVADPKIPAGEVPDVPPQSEYLSQFEFYPELLQARARDGSNNWAISGARSATGHSIISNDTHLGYALPNTWYEMQLVSPDTNVYGATFPAAPGIVVGFTKGAAWAVTNATPDVLDWYEIEFSDEGANEYKFGEEWRPVRRLTETIRVRGGKEEKLETLWTHLGVVVDRKGKKGLTLRWIVHEGQTNLKAFYDLNRAENFESCRRALSSFEAPSQNFICADKDNIGIWHLGRFPKRYKGQGQTILLGEVPENDWNHYLRFDELPHSINPAEGFLGSANQPAVNQSYPYYMGWFYDDSYRASRIYEELAQAQRFTWEDMAQLHMDQKNNFAAQLVPQLILALGEQTLSGPETKAIEVLKSWDHQMAPDSIAPTLYSNWWHFFQELVWEDQLRSKRNPEIYPLASQLLHLLRQANQGIKEIQFWFDDIHTEEPETHREIAKKALSRSLEDLESHAGPVGKKWHWGRYKVTQFPHMGRIPGFGSKDYFVGGCKYCLNANRFAASPIHIKGDKRYARHGATWRMVVELGDEPRGFTQYPGGPSGNPFDPRYSRFLEGWSKGELRAVKFMSQIPDSGPKTQFVGER